MLSAKDNTEGLRDDLTYRWASLVLRTGMYLSFGLMILGLAWWLLAGAQGDPSVVSRPVPLDRLPSELTGLNPLAFLNLGVVLLLATPGVVLLVQIVTFAMARNWRYMAIAALVGLILLFSLAVALKWI